MRSAPHGTVVANPAFDVTPAEYIAAIVTERGVLTPPFTKAIDAMLRSEPISNRVRS